MRRRLVDSGIGVWRGTKEIESRMCERMDVEGHLKHSNDAIKLDYALRSAMGIVFVRLHSTRTSHYELVSSSEYLVALL